MKSSDCDSHQNIVREDWVVRELPPGARLREYTDTEEREVMDNTSAKMCYYYRLYSTFLQEGVMTHEWFVWVIHHPQ